MSSRYQLAQPVFHTVPAIPAGRAAVVAQLARAIGPVAGSPDPELTAHALSALADEAARLVLADPVRFPPARVLDHARWILRAT